MVYDYVVDLGMENKHLIPVRLYVVENNETVVPHPTLADLEMKYIPPKGDFFLDNNLQVYKIIEIYHGDLFTRLLLSKINRVVPAHKPMLGH